MRATKGLAGPVRSSVPDASPPPWCTLVLLAAIVLVAAATLAPGGTVRADELAWGWSDGLTPGLVLWPLSHPGWWHVAVNTTVLFAFAPALERYVGPWRLATCLVAGNVGGLLAHLLLNPSAPPLLGCVRDGVRRAELPPRRRMALSLLAPLRPSQARLAG